MILNEKLLDNKNEEDNTIIHEDYPYRFKLNLNSSNGIDINNISDIFKETNEISTSKYTFLNFLPKILYEHFQKTANIYFLIIAILQVIPEISYTDGKPIIAIPLVIVILISGLKDFFEDYKREIADREQNSKSVEVYFQEKKSFVSIKWKDLKVGNIIRILKNEHFPADLLLLKSFCLIDGKENDALIKKEMNKCFIETKNLDGETNLKSKYVNDLISKKFSFNEIDGLSLNNIEKDNLHKMNISLEKPNEIMNKFRGVLKIENQSIDLDFDSFLSRGCSLQNTDEILCFVLYVGKNTKMMLNSPNSKYKISNVERKMSKMIIFILFIQLFISIIASIISYLMLKYETKEKKYFLENILLSNNINYSSIFLKIFTWILIFTNFVPISLLVTMELIKHFQGYFMSWDINLYDKINKKTIKVQTSTLNEELGQVKYIFTDKTGTLTKNKMTYKGFSLGRSIFYFSELENTDKIKKQLEQNDQCLSYYLEYVFNILSLCHSIVNMSFYKINYLSSSPDETALINGASNYDYTFIGELKYDKEILAKVLINYNISLEDHLDPNNLPLDNNFSQIQENILFMVKHLNKLYIFQKIFVINYSSERKRMSIILKDLQKDKYILYIKGADTILKKMIDATNEHSIEILNQTIESMKEFVKKGFRTLMIGFKHLKREEIDVFTKEYKMYYESTDLQRKDKIDKLFDNFEKNITIIGSTAIEDELQDDVKSTIQKIFTAGINVWMLTGDKPETAISIGHSCGLIEEDMDIIELFDENDLFTSEKIKNIMINFLNKNKFINIKKSININTNIDSEIKEEKSKSDIFSKYNDSNKSDIFIENIGNTERKQSDDEISIQINTFYLVVSSHCLNIILNNDELLVLFKLISLQCQSVLCCRVSPKQKAAVVKLTDKISLAVGDGANDVNMITTAKIGIGIEGEEGSQASTASDYAIPKFNCLSRLLFFHGRESYRKNTYVILYNFYKNIVFVMPQFWFGYNNFYTGVTLYDPIIYQLYNLIFTTFPIIWFGIYDVEKNEDELVNDVRYYKQGIINKLFRSNRFLIHNGYAFIEAFIIYFISYNFQIISVNGKDDDIWYNGTIMFLIIVFIVNLRMFKYINSINLISIILFIFSVGSFIVTLYVTDKYPSFKTFNHYTQLTSSYRNLLIIFFCVFSIIVIEYGIKKIMVKYNFVINAMDLDINSYFKNKDKVKTNKLIEKVELSYLGYAFSEESREIR